MARERRRPVAAGVANGAGRQEAAADTTGSSARLKTRVLEKLLLHPKTRSSRGAIADENRRRVRETLT